MWDSHMDFFPAAVNDEQGEKFRYWLSCKILSVRDNKFVIKFPYVL